MASIATIATLVLRLVLLLAEQVREKKSENVGWGQAIEAVLAEAHKDAAFADAERKLIADGHASDSSDGAFDSDFRRS